ncbi:MAG TPA: TlyA family rRNA (cytidine-2'-O)-methyltransferase [Nitrospira sp.]|jgi:23S rRNA (cytidine1920-2'-O)/16S rRNA (cytidine1409-2'-O)-methyltransferase|nr:TlyA family rRNA (cytidine-2'-O)-methyltransferase [Nitrospira sp.]
MVQNIRPVRERLDRVLVNRGLVASREDAARLILAGLVRVDGMVVDKAAKLTLPDASVEVTGRGSPYVGRGGEKLAGALDQFQVDPKGMTCFDVGCSTGGFTDCLLQRGASRVYAVDVGYGQFEWRLRQDARVVLMERTNVRHLPPDAIPEPIDLIVIDVSFISLTLVLPCVVPYLTASGSIITLIKPQFEVGKGLVGRGGIVRDDGLREGAAEKVFACALSLGLEPAGRMESPIEGRKGNREILAWFRHKAQPEENMREMVVSGADENTLRKSTEGVG